MNTKNLKVAQKRQKSKRTYPKGKRNKLDVKNYNYLKKLNGVYSLGLRVTFVLPDGSKKVTPINDKFLEDRNGKSLHPAAILEKLNTFKHDYNADEYLIQ